MTSNLTEFRAWARELLREIDLRLNLRWATVLGDALYGPSVPELLERLARLEREP